MNTGPGHKPVKPHPTPKKIAPVTNFQSISEKFEKENDLANRGFF